MDKDHFLVKYLRYNSCKRSQVWQFFSYMLIHDNLVHLLFNIIIQLILGVVLELQHKWRILVIYLAGGLAGCLGNTIFTPTGNLCGASAGLYALWCAHVANIIMVRMQ